MEIGRENNNTNNKTFEQVKNEFFYDLKSYEEILGSRNERDRLQRELKNLEIQTIKKKDVMHIQKLCKASKDYQMQEFMKMILLRWTTSMTEAHLYKNKPGKYKQNLIDDLQVWKFKASYRKSTR